MQIPYLPLLFSYIIMRMFLLLFSFFFFAIPSAFSSFPPPTPHLTNVSDQEALLGFRSAITSDTSQFLSDWNPNVSFCHWTGIICSRRRQRVVSLDVSSMGLQGTISPLLGNLSFLRTLSLRNNSFHGHIPYQLGHLFRLKMLRLSLNQLQDSIPPTLGGCRSLRNLTLSYNNLTGNIPSELCVLPELPFFNLADNSLTGTIPTCLGNISSLQYIYLDRNNLHGSVPSELCVLSKLQTLTLGRNSLTGTIPACLGNISSLQYLQLYQNNLHGSVPSELCVLSKLQTLALGRNSLTGTIPACLGNISSLQYLLLDENNLHGSVPFELGMLSQVKEIVLALNHLTGQIPSSLSNCTNLLALDISHNQLTSHIPAELCTMNIQLTKLYLWSNQLSGSIPASLFNCTNLLDIDIGSNQLSGVVPMELGKLKQLRLVNLGYNQLRSSNATTLSIFTALSNCSVLKKIVLSANYLTGRLPFSIGHLSTKLDWMDFDRNQLAGEIPPQIGNLTGLTLLNLSGNSFTGSIPPSLSMLQKLERLFLGSNNLQGSIPTEIGKLKSLGLLSLEQNNLSGKIPDSLAHLQQLRYLYLNHNQLSRTIPASLGKCMNLLLLDLSHNKLSGHIPPEVVDLANLAFYFNLSNNLLHGPMPSELSKMTMIQAIDISANRLTGYIPSSIGSCKEVEYLNISCNALEGPIPVSLGELQSLQCMDFSSNNLSGGIPMSLQNLKMLDHLNFSFNNLSGEVPKGGVFKKFGATSFMGNLGLCGPWVSLSPCTVIKHNSTGHLKRDIIVVIAIIATVVVLCLLFAILWRQNHKKHIISEASFNVGHRRISYGELLNATDEFSDANLLGVGSFGKVYKGILNDGTIVAIKFLNVQNERAQKSFDKECQVLSRVRHRNLIRVITSYSNLQVKALIFPLMPNGSLEMWLYPHGEEKSSLSLIQRLNIAIDIAEGMVYLHHHCFVQVIHCDLKPNNVLLGEDMTSYLIDFGIATICFANSEDSALTSTHALKGSAGYIPPEYGLGGRVTTKGDVYSYGILLLEMLTGEKPTNNMFVEGMSLPKWVDSAFPNQVGDVVDESLLRSTNMVNEQDKDLNCLRQLISVGLLCTKESPKGRPTMLDVVGTLQNVKGSFLGVTGIPKFQLEISHLLGSSSTTQNNSNEPQSSSTLQSIVTE